MSVSYGLGGRVRYVFEKVEYRAVKSVPCAGCGKKIRRQRTFWATENPFNVNLDGTPRTRAEIRERLREMAAAWDAQPERHARCAA